MAVTIRPLRLSDYDAIIEVLAECEMDPRTHGRDARNAIAKQLRSNRTLYLGAFLGRRLVGTVFGTHDTRKGWINRLAVRPDCRRGGVATMLVRACECALERQGLEVFAALVEGDNTASQRLFSKLGYTTSGVRYYRRKLREDV